MMEMNTLPREDVYANINHSVALECLPESSTSSMNLTIVTSVVWWKSQPGRGKFAKVGSNLWLAEDYRNRVSISNINGQLNIHHVQLTDSGCFMCVDSGVRKQAVHLHIHGELSFLPYWQTFEASSSEPSLTQFDCSIFIRIAKVF